MSHRAYLAALAAMGAALPAFAQVSRISEDIASVTIDLNGRGIIIDRQGPACPPACVQPMQAAPGVATIGELEVLDFLSGTVAAGGGLLVDARLPDRFAEGTVPGAVNVPEATLHPQNPYRDDLLAALGAQRGNFAEAYDLVIFGEGANATDAAQALRHLAEAGYPAEKLKYYRGGLTAWRALGLTTAQAD
ncbi:rhodanese-like domain-containing protein [Thetidibacter halocola]|uniref:Rhodanese-like domain-containing protein n=1 Tax=Thetidibacter halocola TaxID=2827239 RepID=A0A8J7WDN1_9RHOB|nr:rhodanese-like domain-containing protein [Thetidibacter halocola]MBS0125690.1 rhodanese-like domain-containing protein [Thetidibacter halocola]